MATFTNEQTKHLMIQAGKILNNIAEGESVRDIMARLYVENLDDKTMQQGLVMADAILNAVKDFDASYREAQEDLDTYIRKFQKKVDEGKSCVERCNYWLHLSAAIAAANEDMAKGGANREEILKQIEGLRVSAEEANEDLEKELRDKARETLKNSGILLTGLVDQVRGLEGMASADEAAGLLIDLGNHEIEYRALAAMLAYTKVKVGEMENIPVDMTAVQMTNLVCTQIEQTRILEGVGKGSISMVVAEILLGALGAVVLIKVSIPLIVVSVVAAVEMFGAVLMIPAMLMAVCLIIKLLNKAMDEWFIESKQIIKTVSVSCKLVVKGIAAVVDYIKDSVIPAVSEKAKKLLTYLRAKFQKEKVRATPEEINVPVEEDDRTVADEEPVTVQPVIEPGMEVIAT